MNEKEILERIYAGFIGMNAGIRLGAPVEPTIWTSDRIKRFYGDITGYVKPFKNFAADDDANGPVFFLRAIDDMKHDGAVKAEDVAEAWLNYAREGVGMFWWGGYGISTEHTAYLNLKNGVMPPLSGAEKTNGKILAEQIGGQIFIDTWGLIHPMDPDSAAKAARVAASVSHDGEGLEGASFVASCIAVAFETDDVDCIISEGLKRVSADSLYKKVVESVVAFHEDHEDWRDCLAMLQKEWGYDKYPGVCHIIPNAGVVAMALVYGRTFSRGIEIATMAGWDTDCNAGNVGTILGVAGGIAGIPDHYSRPINDSIVLSSISGFLNVLDIPTYAKKLCSIAMRIKGIEPSSAISYDERHPSFDFSIPGSTHGLRVSNNILTKIKHSAGMGKDGSGALEVLFDRMIRGQSSRIYYKSFYRRNDFDDERYMPVFSPTVYSGESVSITFRFERIGGESMIISPYVMNSTTKEIVYLGGEIYRDEDWHTVSFVVPDLAGAMIEEVGIILEANSPSKNKDLGSLFISSFVIEGKSEYDIDISKSRREFASIIPFSHNNGAWEIVGSKMECMSLNGAEALTGNYYARDIEVAGSVIPYTGDMHLISLRVQGAQRGYYAGLDGDGISIIKKRAGNVITLAHDKYNWEYGSEYALMFKANGSTLEFSLNGKELIKAEDSEYGYGMIGYGEFSGGRRAYGNMHIKEID